MHLIYEDTGRIVKIGDTLTTREGEKYVLRHIQTPHKPSSTGRVYVSRFHSVEQAGYFPVVFNLVWEGRDDQ